MADQLNADEATIPHEVVSAVVDGATPMHAWRDYFTLTQEATAARLNITVPAYARQEACATPERPMLEKFAAALGLTLNQLDF